jgi:23S rRNA pseudouridine1911/1915/1917 synthase
MSCHGFSSRESRSLANFLLAHHPFLNGVGESVWEAGLVHRLDRDTSGVVLAAKDREAYQNLRGQFRRQTVRKRYSALVWGWTAQREMLSWPLAHDPKDRRRMMVLQNPPKENFSGKRWKAVTRFKTLRRSRSFSFIEIEIFTGVTHQIRAQLEAAGHPLVGDPLYGGNAPPSELGRQFLHATSLEMVHPRKGCAVTFESPLPADLRKVLDGIGMPSF